MKPSSPASPRLASAREVTAWVAARRRAAQMNEMDIQIERPRLELRETVDRSLRGVPIIGLKPMVLKLLHGLKVRAIGPAAALWRIGPLESTHLRHDGVDRLAGNIDREGGDRHGLNSMLGAERPQTLERFQEKWIPVFRLKTLQII